jgi:hypothetical protein
MACPRRKPKALCLTNWMVALMEGPRKKPERSQSFVPGCDFRVVIIILCLFSLEWCCQYHTSCVKVQRALVMVMVMVSFCCREEKVQACVRRFWYYPALPCSRKRSSMCMQVSLINRLYWYLPLVGNGMQFKF